MKPALYVNEAGRCVQVVLEDVPYRAEWIPGEGADVALYRALDDDRIVGANLPLPDRMEPEKNKPGLFGENLTETIKALKVLLRK